MIPGWPYSFVAALETGRTSWTAVLDAVRLGPADDATGGDRRADTRGRGPADRGRAVAAGRPGDPDRVSTPAMTSHGWRSLLADLPVVLLGRLRSDRVLRLPPAPRCPGPSGRPPRHGGEFALARPATWPAPQHITSTKTTRYGTARRQRLGPAAPPAHPPRRCWLDHHGELPVIDGTLIRLQVDHLPGDRDPKPVWLWCSATAATPAEVDRWWQAFLRRFDLEHTFRLFKQVLGWTAPKIRNPAGSGPLDLADHRRPYPAPPRPATGRGSAPALGTPCRCTPGLTPARVRRGFRNIRAKAPCPAGAPKPGKPGPGRPPGSLNRRPAQRHDVGKNPSKATPTASSRKIKG